VCQDLLKRRKRKKKAILNWNKGTAPSLVKILVYLIRRRKTASGVSKFSYKLISHLINGKKRKEKSTIKEQFPNSYLCALIINK
jgi:hypothetical protein